MTSRQLMTITTMVKAIVVLSEIAQMARLVLTATIGLIGVVGSNA